MAIATTAPAGSGSRRLRLVGVGAWVVFGLAWWRVVALDAMVSSGTLLALLGAALLIVSVDLWWVTHNRNIYRRKGPRRARPVVSAPYVQDTIGRPIRIDPTARRAAEVSIAVDADGTKVYRPAAGR